MSAPARVAARSARFASTLLAACAAALLLTTAVASDAGAGTVTSYTPVHFAYDSGGGARLAVRRFERDGVVEYLAFDLASSTSTIASASEVEGARRLPEAEAREYTLTKSLATNASVPDPSGRKGGGGASGTYLTVDLCTSKKPIDKQLFEAAAALGGGAATPVAVAVSGSWIKKHGEELSWLIDMERAGRLQITWVNHSYSHPYRGGETKTDEDFLLTPGVDFEAEVLRNEALMLEAGLVPSPFFRFPGLVKSPALAKKLAALDLVALGADAWLAKGEEAREGSVILVHGNGNEPDGIKRLLALYAKDGNAFGRGGRLAHRRLGEAVRALP